MTPREDEDLPLDADLVALLRDERAPLEVSSAQLDRARYRLDTRLAARAALGGASWLPRAASLAAAGIGCVAIGVAVRGWIAPPASPVTGLPAASTPSAESAIAPATAIAPTAPAPVATAPKSSAPAVASSEGSVVRRVAAPTVVSVSGERELLDRAHRALREGEPTRALAIVETAAARFPRGALEEERAVVRIEALVAAHRQGEAETAARMFRSRWPASPFLPAVESRVGPL